MAFIEFTCFQTASPIVLFILFTKFAFVYISQITPCPNRSWGRIFFHWPGKKWQNTPKQPFKEDFRVEMVQAVDFQQTQHSSSCCEGLSFYMPLFSTLLLWRFFRCFCISVLNFPILQLFSAVIHFSHTYALNIKGVLVPYVLLHFHLSVGTLT